MQIPAQPILRGDRMKTEYLLLSPHEIDNSERQIFGEMLEEQGKVNNPSPKKADRCKYLCFVKVDGATVAIGAIKPKTSGNFSVQKSGLTEMAQAFDWELGYLFTKPDYEGRGIASNVVRCLIDAYGVGNLMASTEISANPAMVRLLEKNGFKLFGRPWPSTRNEKNYLGLFLRFK